MKLTKLQYNSFKKNGYLIIKNFIKDENCRKILNILKKQKKINELDKDHPYSLINSKLKVIIPNDKSKKILHGLIKKNQILEIGDFLTKKKMSEWFIKFYPKNEFDGDNEFYHQDFAYHKSKKAPVNDYIQCFMAIENHNLSGGCLRVFKGSHKLGLIKHYNVMTRNGLFKLTPSAQKLLKINKKYKLKELELKSGSCIFFNYNLIHGSSSNASSNSQCRMVFQMIAKNSRRNDYLNKKVWKKRNDEEIKFLKKIISYKIKKGGKNKN